MKKIKRGWFTYDPEEGAMEFHDTEAEAKAEAAKIFQIYVDDAADGWHEEVDRICWGKVSQIITETSRKAAPPGESFDEYITFDFRNPHRATKKSKVAP